MKQFRICSTSFAIFATIQFAFADENQKSNPFGFLKIFDRVSTALDVTEICAEKLHAYQQSIREGDGFMERQIDTKFAEFQATMRVNLSQISDPIEGIFESGKWLLSDNKNIEELPSQIANGVQTDVSQALSNLKECGQYNIASINDEPPVMILNYIWNTVLNPN